MTSMPASTTHMNLIRIACNSCSGSSPSDTVSVSVSNALAAAATVSADTDSSAQLKDLSLKIQETEGAASTLTNEVYDKWTFMFQQHQATLKKLEDYVAKHLTITVKGEDTLTEHQKNLVQILLQASNFVYFLEKEETQEAYGQKADSLVDLKGRLMQVVCATRQLLAKFSNKDIEGFVKEHVYQSLQMTRVSDGLRRAVCAATLKLMATVLSTVDLTE